MSYLTWLVPIALGMGVAGLAAFLWSMRSGQYEDLDGAAERVLLADAAEAPLRQDGWKNEAPEEERSHGRNALPADGVRSKTGTERNPRDTSL
ncbi:cbb3-type cytochrome oxidase assembly protein CcoS [Mesorhizobium sp. 1B3]|uniref:cbb3-type cytochrome oxidase assembly protein CcoS n=1 Tax=Mesorhizobium sp. 1B3 TaxID=3243599 RepID=UPI003D9989AC